MTKKKWWKSKTIWYNIITATLGIVQVLSGTFVIPTEVLTLIVGVGNVFLRFVTTDSVDKSVM